MNEKLKMLSRKIKSYCLTFYEKVSMKLSFARENLILTKIGLALLSLCLSVMIWMFVAWDGNSEGTKDITIPVEYVGLTKGYTMETDSDTIVVTVSDKITTLTHTGPEDIKATVHLNGLKTGHYNLPVKLESYTTLQIKTWTPPTVEVKLYRNIERKIPITWRVGAIRDIKKIPAKISLEPHNIKIGGPESDVMSIKSVYVDIPETKIGKDCEFVAPLVFDSDINNVEERLKISTEKIKIRIRREEQNKTLKVPLFVSVTGSPADNVELDSVTTVPDKVFISGKESVVSEIKSLKLPNIDITGLSQDLQLLVPLLPTEMDASVKINGPTKAKITIKLRKKRAEQKFTNVKLQIRGEEKHKRYRFSPSTVQIITESSQSNVNELRRGECPCVPYVDVSNVVEGRIMLPILIDEVKDGFKIVSVQPESVLVSIKESTTNNN